MSLCRRLPVAVLGEQQFEAARSRPPATRRLEVAGTGSRAEIAGVGSACILSLNQWLWSALLLCALLWHGQPATAAESVVAKEYQVKAAFLYNFTKFVEWPEAKFADANAPIVIGVMGHNPFGTVLAEMVKERKISGRGIQIKLINTLAEIKGLHVLFISAAEANRVEALEAALKEGAVLGVGESDTFLTRGGTIRFVLEDDKVRFEIDLNSAEHAQLKISSQLLRLARVVKPKL